VVREADAFFGAFANDHHDALWPSTDLCAAWWTVRPDTKRRRISTSVTLNGSRSLLPCCSGSEHRASVVAAHTFTATYEAVCLWHLTPRVSAR